MFITCKEIPRRALSVFSQERQRVALRPEVREAEERKKREERTRRGSEGDEEKQKKRYIASWNFAHVPENPSEFVFPLFFRRVATTNLAPIDGFYTFTLRYCQNVRFVLRYG